MLQPKKQKYRKQQKGRRRKREKETRAINLDFGSIGLKAMENIWLTARQIEAARKVMVRYLRKGGKMWIRVFPDKPITKKPLEVRMGKGKGSVEFWVAQVKPGTMLYEIQGVPEQLAREAFTLAAAKLPIKTTFVARTIM